MLFTIGLLLGLIGGYVGAGLVGQGQDVGELVFHEAADSTFPVAGAAFTASTYDPETEECDPEKLRAFLKADPHRFSAWLDLLDVEADEFDDFVDRLETRILHAPTRVTNHGCFMEGTGSCPFEVQSVLAVGTPVWYDPLTERIVAKCYCSNPLKTPKCPPNCDTDPTPTPVFTPTPTPEDTRPPTRSPSDPPPVQTRPPGTTPGLTLPPPATSSPGIQDSPTPDPTPTPTFKLN